MATKKSDDQKLEQAKKKTPASNEAKGKQPQASSSKQDFLKEKTKSKQSEFQQQNPLIMRCHRLIEVFAKSDDERDFYLDRQEGFLIYFDLDKSQQELNDLEKELTDNSDRYCMIPKLTFYEIKKIMEGFVNEKVYDIDTKEKLLDIIQSKEARENFLEFIYDHHSELEKWQQYYQEKFRVRIIEWLRNNQFDFVFEEDLEMTKSLVEKLKMNTFVAKVGKDILQARKLLVAKAKTYYSNEALNPRPKRGRPPKQVVKVETEPQFSLDIYTTVPKVVKPFLFTPEYHGTTSIFTFSGKFASEADLIAHKRQQITSVQEIDSQNIDAKLATLRSLSSHWMITTKEVGAVGESELSRPLNGDFKSSVSDFSDDFDESEMNMQSTSRYRELKKEKKAEESFFQSRKMRQSGVREEENFVKQGSSKEQNKKSMTSAVQNQLQPKKGKEDSKAPKQESSKKEAPSSKTKNTPKARLRPLKKAVAKKTVKEKMETKKKTSPLRHLRRAKKK